MTRREEGQLARDLIAKVAEDSECYQYQVRSVIISLIRVISSELAQGKTVNILSLGKFWVKMFPAKGGYDPWRKKKIDMPARGIPRFTFGRRMLEFIKEEVAKTIPRP